MIGKTISHYKILEKLGGGGMGIVYKARDQKLDRLVALKFLPPELTRNTEARDRFAAEAKAVSSLQHANICTIHDIEELDAIARRCT
jgi:serine/threonine protein kinase